MAKNELTPLQRAAVFTAVAFAVAYLIDLKAVPMLKEAYNNPSTGLLLLPLLTGRMLAPILAALSVLWLEGRLPEWRRMLHIRYPGFQGLLEPGLLVIGVLTLSIPIAILAGSSIRPCPLLEDLLPRGLAGVIVASVILLVGLAAGVSVNMIVALGEEAGWRGLLQDTLSGPVGEPLASALIGVIWGLWHAPLILAGYNYSIPGCGPQGGGPSGLIVFVSLTTGMGLILSWTRYRYGSVESSAAAHGTLNAVAGLYAVLFTGPRLAVPPTGVSASIAAGLVGLALWLYLPPAAEGREC